MSTTTTVDIDLYHVLPRSRDLIASVRDVPLYVFGRRDRNGWTPAVWNAIYGPAAYYGLGRPYKPESCYTEAGVIIVSFEEAMRDTWLRRCAAALNNRAIVWHAGLPPMARAIDALIANHRGWRRLDDETAVMYQEFVCDSLERAVRIVRQLLAEETARQPEERP